MAAFIFAFGSSSVLAQDSRDDEIFGNATTSSQSASISEEASMFGNGPSSDAEIQAEQVLEETNDTLVIGGRAFLGVNYNIQRDADPSDYTINSPNLVDVYLDARPNDYVRSYMRGRLLYDPSQTDGQTNFLGREEVSTRVQLQQLWLKFNIERKIFVTMGRQPLKWGSSRFWNPSDFVNLSIRDPLAVFDQRFGPSLIKMHYPIESLGWNFYAIATMDNVKKSEDVGGALRGEFLFGNTEISLSTLAKKDQPLRMAFDISTAVWDLDFRFEGTVQHGLQTPFYRRIEGASPLTSIESYTRENEWLFQWVAGADITIQYSDEDSVGLGVEYFSNDTGYEDASLYPLLALRGQFQPFYLGQHYIAGYMFLAAPGSWNDSSFIGSVVGNLSDESYLARVDYRVLLMTFLTMNVFATYHMGQRGEFKFGLSVPPVGGVPGLEQGLELLPPTLDLGVRFTVNF